MEGEKCRMALITSLIIQEMMARSDLRESWPMVRSRVACLVGPSHLAGPLKVISEPTSAGGECVCFFFFFSFFLFFVIFANHHTTQELLP